MMGMFGMTNLFRQLALWAAFAVAGANPAFAATPCDALAKMRIPARAIALPSAGAVIDSATVHTAEADIPETCRVIGRIIAVGAGVPAIRFEVNLPPDWNGKALHFGGGGLDGTLVDGLRSMPGDGPVTHAPANPLARGFVTFGSDAGHQASNPGDAAFGRIAQARANYAGEAVKRTHDAAIAVITRFYGSPPRRMYFAGGSKGGHEGLIAAQRYGADYDGVIAFYPAKDSVGLILGWGALSQAAYGPGGGALSAAKQQFLKTAVLNACDGLDGLKDGIISDTAACAATIAPVSLHCASTTGIGAGTDTSACLTDAEIRVLDLGLTRQSLPYPLANGVATIGPFPVMSGAAFAGIWLSPNGPDATAYGAFVNGVIRNFWTDDDTARFATLDLKTHRKTILAYSHESDATSVDLDRFAAHGGKLIVVQGTTDMLVPPSATTDYIVRLAAHYGRRMDGLARYFVQPGYGHGAGDFLMSWDSLGALDTWVETGAFPGGQVATDGNPVTRDRQMPLCEYPAYPRYNGGDARLATSFSCDTR